MTLNKFPVPLPVEGIDLSKPATFIDPRAGFLQNMRYFRGVLRKRPGKDFVGSRIASQTPIMGMGVLDLGAQRIKYAVRNSRTEMEVFNTSLNDWESIINTPFAAGEEDFFSYCTVTESGLLLATNGVDRIRKWPGSGNAQLLGGNPPKAKYIAYLSPYVVLFYLDDGSNIYPWKVAWCDTDNPEVWTGGNSGSKLLSDEPSIGMNLKTLNEFLVAYKKDSIWLGRKVDPPDIFQWDKIKTGIGLAAPRALAEADGRHFFMGANDFYTWNGIREEAIGGDIRAIVFDSIDRSRINRCFAEHIQEETEVRFFLVYSGDEWPKVSWNFNYKTGRWYFDTCDPLTCALKWERINTQSWDQATGTWDQQQGAWDSATRVSSWEDILLGRSDGYAGKIDYTTTDDFGVAVSSHVITKDFTDNSGREINVRWQQLDTWMRGPGKVFADYSIDEGNTWVNIPYSSDQAYVELTSTYQKNEWYFDVVSTPIRFRLRNAGSRETFYLREFVPYYLPIEEIRSYRG